MPKCADLAPARRGSHPEDGVPGLRLAQTLVELVGETHLVRWGGVVMELAGRLSSQLSQRGQIFEISGCKAEEVEGDLLVRSFLAEFCEPGI